jgi:hypothetical protein
MARIAGGQIPTSCIGGRGRQELSRRVAGSDAADAGTDRQAKFARDLLDMLIAQCAVQLVDCDRKVLARARPRLNLFIEAGLLKLSSEPSYQPNIIVRSGSCGRPTVAL